MLNFYITLILIFNNNIKYLKIIIFEDIFISLNIVLYYYNEHKILLK
jgi:hypothetical protein